MICVPHLHIRQRGEKHKHSAVGKHLKEGHDLNPINLHGNFKVIKKCWVKLECLILEMHFIQKKRLKLNTQADSIHVKLFLKIAKIFV